MNEFTTAAALWALQAATAGAVLLLLGRASLAFTRTPEARYRTAGWILRAVVLVPFLCILPAWWSLPVPPVLTGSSTPDGEALREPQLASRLPVADGPELAPPLVATDTFVPNLDDEPTATEPIFLPEPLVDSRLPEPPVAAFRDAVLNPESPADAGEPATPEAAFDMPTWADGLRILGILYAIAWLVYAFDFVRGTLLLNRLRSESVPASMRVSAAASTLAGGMKPTPRVLTHLSLSSPVCFGVLRPTIVLPKPTAW